MNESEMLKILKYNLQKLSSADDEYLKKLIIQAIALMSREGIVDDGTDDYDMTVIDYAAFLFRKRAKTEKVMPRFLRIELNNLLFSQKSK